MSARDLKGISASFNTTALDGGVIAQQVGFANCMWEHLIEENKSNTLKVIEYKQVKAV